MRVMGVMRRRGDTPTNILTQFIITFGVWLLGCDRIAQAVPNFQYRRGWRLQRLQPFAQQSPVDGAVAWPQVLVFLSVIVMHV